MKKLLLVALGFTFFACETTTRETETTESSETTTTETTDESVDIGSGTEISPQLEGVEDSARRLEVDTISTSTDANQNR